MPIQNSTEQLIEHLMQNRAKAYADETRRFRAQSAKEKKRAEASEKKQLKVLDSIGIKKEVLDREQRNDASELKKKHARH